MLRLISTLIVLLVSLLTSILCAQENPTKISISRNVLSEASEMAKQKTKFNNYNENFKVSRDTRVAVVTYTYNFGAGNPTARRRTGGADDLKQRAGNTNG